MSDYMARARAFVAEAEDKRKAAILRKHPELTGDPRLEAKLAALSADDVQAIAHILIGLPAHREREARRLAAAREIEAATFTPAEKVQILKTHYEGIVRIPDTI